MRLVRCISDGCIKKNRDRRTGGGNGVYCQRCTLRTPESGGDTQILKVAGMGRGYSGKYKKYYESNRVKIELEMGRWRKK